MNKRKLGISRRGLPRIAVFAWVVGCLGSPTAAAGTARSYAVVDTGQEYCYDLNRAVEFPEAGRPFYGQDAQYNVNQPSYTDNDDGTVRDNVTGLEWTQVPAERMTYHQAVSGAARCRAGGYFDWRLPTIKELYSLVQFSGTDPDPMSVDTTGLAPFIDASFFRFQYGDPSRRERIIDAQYASSTRYASTTMNGMETVFGVNFADGRLKGYGLRTPRGEKTFYVLYVRGNPDYGTNHFKDNRDGTITDQATGLTWVKADSARGMPWPTALQYAENMELAGHSDWRLPNAKELQSIVDYSRSPDTTGSAAIDPIFDTTEITNESGGKDFAQYWTSSSHVSARGAQAAVYLAFGRSLGYMQDHRTGRITLMDVHGAGSQRSDPKVGDASEFPTGRGPQGDVVRIKNMVRCVRGGNAKIVASGPRIDGQHSQSQRWPGPPPSFSKGEAGGYPRGPRGAGFVKRLDRDGDGQVSRNEFDGPPNHFSRLDRNRNGYLSEDEAPMAPPPGRHPPEAITRPVTMKERDPE